ncbi:MAG: sigma-70 family RNA polymerase sigma factor [Polyangiaceae bacterium]
MNDSESKLAALAGPVGASWRSFVESVEPMRPELYRYCRHLTRSPWDAEDLVQETMLRSFVSVGWMRQEIRSPRAWLFRVASNLWLNRLRGSGREVLGAATEEAGREQRVAGADPRATREAAASLIGQLAPQERAAVVLKDVFDFSLEEAAAALETSVGAVKAALHRGRGKLRDPEVLEEKVPVPEALHAFCAAFNARDLDAVVALLLDDVVVQAPGLGLEIGADEARRGSLRGVLFGNPTRDYVAPEHRGDLLPQGPRLEIRVHRGEALMLGWFAHESGEAVRAISRVRMVDGRVAAMTTYLHAPDVLAEICEELGVPFRSSGYRYWWS